MPRANCLTPAELASLQLGNMPETALAELGAHLETCIACEAAARALDEITDPVLAALRRSVAAPLNAVPDQPPQRIGDYEIVAEIGRGGMGVVYRARHGKLHRQVALKMLLEGEFADLGQRQRFLREAEAVARLQHPHIVQIFEIGEHQADSGLTRPYFTLEFVDGGNLAARLSGRPATPRQAAAWLEPMARAIHYAHKQGIVHRDLKPSNVLVTSDGQPKLCDFGIAKLTHDANAKTQSGTILGTPEYMAPEQAAGQGAIGPGADIHALGAILYTMLTGRPPFQGATGWETLSQVQALEPVPPRRLQLTVPRDLETICLKCLQKEPKRRYTSAEGLADDLRRFLTGEPIVARPVSPTERAWKWCKRHPWESALAALFLLAALVGSASWAWFAQQKAERAARTTEAVHQAMREVALLRGQAQAATEQESTQLGEALAVARRADALLLQGDVDTGLREQVQTILTELEGEQRAAQERMARIRHDRRMVAELEEIRLSKTAVKDHFFDYAAAGPLYASAFREYGIDVLTLTPEDAAQRIAACRIRPELIAALDDWAFLSRPEAGGSKGVKGRLLDIANRSDPDVWRTRLRRSLVAADRVAVKELAKSADLQSLSGATVEVLCEALTTIGEAPEAVTLLRRAHLVHPKDPWISHALGVYLEELKPPRLDEAVRFHTAAWVLRSDSPGMTYNLARALVMKGNREDSITYYRLAIRLKPDYAEAYTNVGAIFLAQGRPDKAVIELREAIRIKPSLVQAHNNLGVAYHDQGDKDAAIVAFREAIKRKPNYASPHLGLGTTLREQGKLDEAITEYREAIRADPKSWEAHGNLGLLLTQKGPLEEAVTELRITKQLKPDSASNHYNLGIVLVKLSLFDEAIAEYREAIRLQPTHAEAHCNLGFALQRKGQFPEALASLRRGHELGSKRKNWPYPSADWVRQAEELVKQAQQKP